MGVCPKKIGMIVVKMPDLLDGLDFSSFDDDFEAGAYVCRETGKVYCFSAENGFDEDLPEDLTTSGQYVELPSKHDFDLGVPLVMAFVEEVLPEDLETVADYFSRRGAYREYGELLERRGVRERWYAFEAAATQRALREWAQAQGFSVKD